MHTYWIVFSWGAFISLIGYIWLTVVGFKRSVLWGLAVLLLSPISAIIFAITNWRDAKKAFLVYAVAMVLMLSVVVVYMSKIGPGLKQIVVRVDNGELTREQARNQLDYLIATGTLPPKQESADADTGKTDASNDTGASTAKIKQKTKPVSEPPTRLATAAKVYAANSATASRKTASASPPNINDVPPDPLQQQATVSNQGDANSATDIQKNAPARPPNINDVPPDPLQQKSMSSQPRTVAVSLGGISRYLGRYFIITVKGGTRHRGLLRRVEARKLIFERKLYGGKFEYGIRKDEIKSIRMLTYIPDEKE